MILRIRVISVSFTLASPLSHRFIINLVINSFFFLPHVFKQSPSAPCNHPGKPKHGKKFGSDYRHGQTVRFGCDAGYKMKGVHNITCSNSRWSGKKPRCVGELNE